jgi:hypothetical protein
VRTIVVGPSDYCDPAALLGVLEHAADGGRGLVVSEVVSAGAGGWDALAVRLALANQLPVRVIHDPARRLDYAEAVVAVFVNAEPDPATESLVADAAARGLTVRTYRQA